MPSMFATSLPAYGWVRIEVDWTDDLSVSAFTLERVDPTTGAATPIRPHTAYSGWAQNLSGGRAMLYDTEAPLDTAFRYRLSSPFDPTVYYSGRWGRDQFGRTVAAGSWGSTDTVEPWAVTPTADHSVSGGTGRQSNGTVNSLRTATVTTLGPNQHITVDVKVPVVPAGAPITLWVAGRATDLSNYYLAQLSIGTTGSAILTLNKRVAGVLGGALASTGSIGTHVAGNTWRVVFEVTGFNLRARAWNLATQADPGAWQVQTTDTAFTTGNIAGLFSRLEGGNTNTLPVVVEWDNLAISNLDQAVATSYTLSSGGGFWFRSPLKPFKDRRVLLRPLPGCPPPGGIFFVGNDPLESREANAGVVAPANRQLGTAISRPRRGVSSAMSLVTRTFTDRDNLLDTLDDGSALQFVAPPEYGLPPRYLSVASVDVQRGLSDHRLQPRLFNLPYTEVAQPAGPAAGVTGARHRDLCATYATWDAVAAAGKTYDDLIRVS